MITKSQYDKLLILNSEKINISSLIRSFENSQYLKTSIAPVNVYYCDNTTTIKSVGSCDKDEYFVRCHGDIIDKLLNVALSELKVKLENVNLEISEYLTEE